MPIPDRPEHHWPEDPVDAHADADRVPPKPRGILARMARAFGDTALTMGLSKGFVGGDAPPAETSLTNTLLFGEGNAKGRRASEGSEDEPSRE